MALLVLCCFFLSGASGLLFEVLWTRELGLVFGSTTLAISTVLSAFMGGLALGSHGAGRLSARIADPLRAYALAEAGVGLYALTVPLALSAYPAINALLWQAIGNHYALLSLMRFVATALLLLLPTTLMGATLPLLSQFLVNAQDHRARTVAGASVHIGTLFALNTMGAVLGTFLAGFVLLPRYGVRATNYVAATINLSLAAVVLLARWRHGAHAAVEADEISTAIDPVSAGGPGWRRRLAVGCYAISGAIAMVYQVLWTRALAVVLGSSVYSFTLILLSFLLGLSAGAAVTTRLLPAVRRPMLWLGLCHLLTLVFVLSSYLTIDKLPAAFLAILRGDSFSVDGLLIAQFVLAALAILPATLLMGAVMPLTMRIYTASTAQVGRDVGTAYALNTIGAIVGSFAAGFVVLPGLGLQRGLLSCAALTALLAAALLWASERRRLGLFLGLSGCLATAVLLAILPRWNLEHFSAGLFRVAIADEIIRHNKWPVPRLLFYRDGISTTVSVEQWNRNLALKNNGKVDASNSDDMATQIMVGLMPLLFHPAALDRPPRVAVIGYGSGVTIGAVTQFPIGHADVVELEPAVVEAGDRFFAEYNHRPSQDPRVRVILGDGRNFLTQARGPDDRYDVIVSEPSNPWITGVSSLFTIDYWRLARARLRDDGVFCQWAQLYELSQQNIKTLLRSFAAVFPYTYAFSAADLSSDVILVASVRPLPLDLSRLRRNFDLHRPQLVAELHRAGVDSAEDVLADLLLVPDELPAFTAGAGINDDDNAHIEFAAPRDLLAFMKHDPYVQHIYGEEWPYGRIVPYLKDPDPRQPARTYGLLARALLTHGKRQAALRIVWHCNGVGGGDLCDGVARLADLLADREATDREEPLVPADDQEDASGPMWRGFIEGLAPPRKPAGITEKDRKRIDRDWAAVLSAVKQRQWAHGLRAMRDWPNQWIEQMGPDFQLLFGYLLYKTDFVEEAVDHLRPLLDDPAYLSHRPAVLYYLARSEYFSSQPRPAVEHLERYRAWLRHP